MNRHIAFQIGCGTIAAVCLLLFPVILSEIKIQIAIEILIFALFAVSFNLLLGYAGLLAFGHAALFGVGAYTTALLSNHFLEMPLVVTFLIAALASFVTSVIIGLFALRSRGVYFSLISFAFQMFLFAVALKWRGLTKGDDGMGILRPAVHLPGLGTLSLMNLNNLYYLTLFVAVLGIGACYFFLKTPLGNAVVCMRENEKRAAFLGYNIFLTKLAAFSLSGVLAGLAGGLFVLFNEFVATNCIDASMSFSIVLMSVIGGTGHFLGPVLGAAFFLVFQDWISSLTDHWWLILGIVFILVVLYLEGGLISLFNLKGIQFWVHRKKR